MNRAYYSDTINNFLNTDDSSIIGDLTISHNHSLEDLQKNAWRQQISILKSTLNNLSGFVFFEFAIPRMGKRVDNVVIINDLIFVIEFKVGSTTFDNYAIEQVIDYSLDLKNFHEGSHHRKLIPILVATNGPNLKTEFIKFEDDLYEPLLATETNLRKTIVEALIRSNGNLVNGFDWADSLYKPTPTIIEAAQALYKGHNVKEISRSDSGAKNLSITANCISDIIDYSKNNSRKSICFVTGVPGAGKTLAGLNIASLRTKIAEDEHAVFLSGNGPLVDVLKEALARDKVLEAKESGERLLKKKADSQVKSFIQNIHHFRDDALRTNEPPIEKVAVFDEAQRAWTKEQASKFMQQKKGRANFNMSEPEFLIEVMDRHKDWCTIICLIGGGQEINTGEAGLEEWFRAFENRFDEWDLYYSSKIVEDKNYLKDDVVINQIDKLNTQSKDELHLAVSVRSFRAEKLSDLIQLIIDLDINKAQSIYSSLKKNYPIVLTRDFEKAKNWLKSTARGSERFGVLASSGAYRLRPHGLNVKAKINAPVWFLNPKDDIRSSYFLEEVATEFDIQGLELDWTCIAWDIDFYFKDGKWNYKKFKGTKWQNVNSPIMIEYLINAYRVLLTRARQGMVLFIPHGDPEDETRNPDLYDSTFELLKEIGFEELE
ncbi:DUF2075 domain-containing protein [Mangrovivirga cuniculi]|uniref:Schlafen group 3-like DNA/RNA helicase domain-containing protein n=1 Tax=Mangrovivirga cuniculi TaxID=2715131 RepID=A0A4D7JKV6_9BACT|nr:DUF2075 domain-containing protein [Mangrovivirga cuniculi]QCK16529.1 hypothetical protein DCC35_18230 [Mangrovivirga cuniculi]